MMSQEPTADEFRTWHGRFGVEANNRAWTLSEKADLTHEDRLELLDAAHAAAHHWRKIGTEAQVAQANLLLGRVHALLGNPSLAMLFASAAFDSITSRDSEPWEVAFAHAVLANAAAVSGDSRLHAAHYEEAKAFGDRLGDEERDLFLATLNLIPQPRARGGDGRL